MLHYADLQRDLVGQMAYLANRLGIEIAAERIEALAPSATFDEMKAAAATTAPNTDISRSKTRRTSSTAARPASGATSSPRTNCRATRSASAELTAGDADFADWLHHGGSAG